MTKAHAWEIPESLLRNLEQTPVDLPIALLLRHSVRDELPPGEAGNEVPITDAGKDIALKLGQKLGARLRSLHSSPLPRCVQTAEAMRLGSGGDARISESRLLGDPGVYVLDGRLAWSNWETLGHEEVMRHLMAEKQALPGMAQPDEAARVLVQSMLSSAEGDPGIHVFVTHDVLVTATVARLQGVHHASDDWPLFLEGALFWRSELGVYVVYRDIAHLVAPSYLVPSSGLSP
ncbi:histidine phosphatase family protein [Uliginosibacterium paludis]|uniref:Histidine phosphatase family protein n=1 Tax=Uliginosibacterium paludis TaxID=1615952 RepID=A0ABV2CS07_9RHOO